MNFPDTWKRFLEALCKPASWPRTVQLAVVPIAVTIAAAALLWLRSPEYKVLFSNLEDRDGGNIVAALGQLNIPYRLSDNGQAILVPADRVHEVRLQLAQQGLPRGGEAGFALLDHTRFGASQFTEQITFQRALEGELASSIQALHAVKAARVHLAIPRETVFVRDRQPPTASVLLSLYPGRVLNESQVNAIAWLVSSSVPNLNAANVSVVAQDGRLLSAPAGEAGMDSARRNLAHDIEQRTVQRILTLLNPLVGSGNVRAQVSVDMDFSQREQTSEVYRPNETPGQASVRSRQTSESLQHNIDPPEGVPGALSNQPPPNATAPIDPPSSGRNSGAASPGTALAASDHGNRQQTSGSSRSDATVNYEVDRTISHVKHPLGTLRRLSAAVVINYRHGADGPEPLPADDLARLEDLVRQAMGYSADRGDSLTVVNSLFTDTGEWDQPFWQNTLYLDYAMQLLRYLLLATGSYLLWRAISRRVREERARNEARRDAEEARKERDLAETRAAEELAAEVSRHEENLRTAREMAIKDPRAVAMVLRSWMEDKDGNR